MIFRLIFFVEMWKNQHNQYPINYENHHHDLDRRDLDLIPTYCSGFDETPAINTGDKCSVTLTCTQKPTYRYSSEFIRSIKRQSNVNANKTDQVLNLVIHLRSLGIYKRYRGCRSGKSVRRYHNRRRQELFCTPLKDEHDPENNQMNGIFGIQTIKSSRPVEWRKRGEGSNQCNLIQISTQVDGTAPASKSIHHECSGHSIYHINATSLAKLATFEQLTADMLEFNVDIGLVTESWLKPAQHPD